jgi:hypothetical protein
LTRVYADARGSSRKTRLIRADPCPKLFDFTTIFNKRRSECSMRSGCCEKSGHGWPLWCFRTSDRRAAPAPIEAAIMDDRMRNRIMDDRTRNVLEWWLEAGVPLAMDRIG